MVSVKLNLADAVASARERGISIHAVIAEVARGDVRRHGEELAALLEDKADWNIDWGAVDEVAERLRNAAAAAKVFGDEKEEDDG